MNILQFFVAFLKDMNFNVLLSLAITAEIPPSLHDFIYFLISIVLLMEVLFFIDLILLLSYTWALSGFLWLTLFSLFLSHYGIVLQDKNI